MQQGLVTALENIFLTKNLKMGSELIPGHSASTCDRTSI